MRLIDEIRRRTVWQVLGLYAAAAWVVLQVVDVLANSLDLPSRYPAIALVLLALGLPLVLATAFVQQRRFRSEGSGEGGDPGQAGSSGNGPGTRSGLRQLLTWRNMIRGGLAAAALWGVLVTAWMIAGGAERGEEAGGGDTVAISRSTVAVLPFSVRGGEAVEYLGEGMVSLLGTKLDGAGELRSVDARALLSYVEREESGTLDPSRGARIAGHFGAGLFVMGDIVEAGGRLRVSALLYDAGRSAPIAEAEAEGDDAFSLVDEVATRLLAGVEGGPGARVRRIAAVTTTSLPAFRAYLEGEAAFRRGRFQPALEAFERAVAADSLYALAYYRMSVAAEWLTRGQIAQSAAEKAYRNASRLSERDRRLLEAFLAWRRGAHEEAERRYRAIVGTYPTDVEAWFQLGEIHFHSNALHGKSVAESRVDFERVLSLEPNDAPSIIHLVRLAASEGRLDDLDSLAARFLALNPAGDRAAEVRAVRAFARADPAGEDSLLEAIATLSDLSLTEVAWNVAMFTNNLSGAERAARLLTDETRFTSEVWTTGHSIAAYALLARGHVADAFREVEAVRRYDPSSATELEALLSLIPLVPVDDAALRRLRAEVEALDPAAFSSSGNPSFFLNILDTRHEVIRLYLLGVLSARLGDAPAALGYAADLEAASPPPGSGTLVHDLAAGVRAHVAFSEGRPDDAVAALEAMRRDIFYQQALASPYDGAVLERYTQGVALAQLGRDEEALGWLSNLGRTTWLELAYLPAARLREAEIHEAAGRPAEAADRYSQFVELWQDADPELQPLVASARAAARRLTEN